MLLLHIAYSEEDAAAHIQFAFGQYSHAACLYVFEIHRKKSHPWTLLSAGPMGENGGSFSGGDAGLTRVALESFFVNGGFSWNSGWVGWQRMFGFAFGSSVGFGPGEEFGEVAVEIGGNRRSGIADFLNDSVFHG